MRGALVTQRTCAVPRCELPVKIRDWCRTHYDRWRTAGDPGNEPVRPYRRAVCSLDGCSRPHTAAGYCNAHYTRWRKYGDPGPVAISLKGQDQACSVEGCDGRTKGQSLCHVHFERKRRTGSVGPAEIKRLTDPTARNDAGEKRCPSCGKWLPLSEYTKCASTPDRLYKRCRRCTRASTLWRSYGLTLEAYEAMLERQGGGCLICSMKPDSPYSLHVDHDHSCCAIRKKSCGRCVRGLLCSPCNTALGLLLDDPRRFRAAAAYLERHRE